MVLLIDTERRVFQDMMTALLLIHSQFALEKLTYSSRDKSLVTFSLKKDNVSFFQLVYTRGQLHLGEEESPISLSFGHDM